ncbi:hypothetical protein OUZ56_000119 [Daphnia magna]|uniref:Uncharacterized protein n=1 Tax=Daphnia magna TaxID=35525 RepID=A0ABQ9ZYR4_9CRUS|nr:hypothetical protein OUZ56_000119 [Daphnia magna]
MIDECKLEVKDAIEINLVLYLDLVNSRALHPKAPQKAHHFRRICLYQHALKIKIFLRQALSSLCFSLRDWDHVDLS